MTLKLTPINLKKRRTGYYLQIHLKNYDELAEFQKGLLSGLKEMRDLEEIKNGEFIYWIAHILNASICYEDYQLWDKLDKQAPKNKTNE